MHWAPINRLAVDGACSVIATGAVDKTVRVWSVRAAGKADNAKRPLAPVLSNILRPPIGDGFAGRVYSVAASPDGRYIVAGGWFGTERTQQYWIYVFEARTGRMARVLGPVSHRVVRLAFSPRGDRLAATLKAGQGLRIWDTKRWRLIAADSNYEDQADTYGLAFDAKGNLYTGSRDGYLRMYTARAIGTQDTALRPGTKIKMTSGQFPDGLAIHAPTGRLAVSYDDANGVDVFEARTMRRLYSTDSTGTGGLGAVAWSSDGRRMFAAGRFNQNGKTVIRVWEGDGKQARNLFPGPTEQIVDLATCGRGIAFTSADPAFGLINELGELQLWQPTVTPDHRANRFENFTVSGDAQRVRFRLHGDEQPVLFDVTAETLTESVEAPPGLYAADMKSVPVSDWIDSLSPKIGEKPLALDNYERVRSLAIAPDRQSVILGTNWKLRAYDEWGAPKWSKPQEAPGFVWGLNISRTTNVIVAAYDDGTIRWHRMRDGRELLALFIHGQDRRWVAWTPKGYYMASAGAESLIGWHLNQAWNEAAQFVTAGRFRDQFNRPDIVKLVLALVDEDRAIEAANKGSAAPRATENVLELAPPIVVIQTPADNSTFSTSEITVEYDIFSPNKRQIAKIDYLIGNAALGARSSAPVITSRYTSGRVTLPVPAADVTITLVAHDQDGRVSDPATIHLRWDGAKPGELPLPRLRAVFVGVNDYTSPKLKKLFFADKDATELAAFFKGQRGTTYSKVDIMVLPDAKRAAVLDGLDWLERESRKGQVSDVSLLFLAGHGITVDQQFYYMAADSDPDHARATGVSRDDILRTIRNRKGSMVVMLDACHSGASLDTPTPELSSVDMNRVANELGDNSSGALLYASASGRQYSYERAEWGHGAFTRAMLDGLAGGADREKLGYVDTEELSLYVRRQVLTMTNNLQAPVRIKPDAASELHIVLLK